MGVVAFSNSQNQAQKANQNEEQENVLKTKAHNKPSGKNLHETELSNLLDKEFKLMIIKMLAKLEGRVELSENLYKETET